MQIIHTRKPCILSRIYVWSILTPSCSELRIQWQTALVKAICLLVTFDFFHTSRLMISMFECLSSSSGLRLSRLFKHSLTSSDSFQLFITDIGVDVSTFSMLVKTL